MADWQQIEDSERGLKKAIKETNEVLVQATTIPSFQRTQLTLNRTKLVIEKRSAFGARDVTSVRVEDVLNAAASAGPIFGTVKITVKPTTSKSTHSVGLFWSKDAVRLKRTIQGYVIALQKKIELDGIPAVELRTLLSELGTDDHNIK